MAIRLLPCLLLFHLLPAVLLGQVSTGTINVEVQDASGAVVPGASITLTHVATGQTRQGLSGERGEFQAFFMPLGNYTVTAELAGFKKTTIAGLELRVDQNAKIAVVLQPGELSEVIQVNDVTPLLETSTSSLGQVIENKKILDLPLNGRNPFGLRTVRENGSAQSFMMPECPLFSF